MFLAMNENLRRESERLAWSWMRHDTPVLRDYLVAGVEDPCLNTQSVLSRHFIIWAALGERFRDLMLQEYRFSAAMEWLLGFFARQTGAEESATVLHALRHGADNAEGLELPRFLPRLFRELPSEAGGQGIPNYIETALLESPPVLSRRVLETFCGLWKAALGASEPDERSSLLEPACGSANDYRFLAEFGLLGLVDYTGFDLCEKNVANARTMFPGATFETVNVFEMSYADRSFDLGLVHDLFEHLSLEGIEAAVAELCRVVRTGLCVHFFNMEEIPAHVVRPVEQYHWNLLSMESMERLFAAHGFRAEILNVGAFLRELVGFEDFHNRNAYTFRLLRV
jgi:SAM-dependent methyltransferase